MCVAPLTEGAPRVACSVFMHRDLMRSTFVGDGEHFEPVEESCRDVLQGWKRTYEDAKLQAYGRWNGADAQLARDRTCSSKTRTQVAPDPLSLTLRTR